MKKSITITLGLFALSATWISCNKTPSPDIETGTDEIILQMEDETMQADVDYTKATAVTSMPGTLYWGGTTGGNAAGTANEATKWSAAQGTVSSSKISTGKYQTYSPTTYNYYVSNVNFTVGADTNIAASNSTDIIAGRGAQTTSTTPSVTLNHIFARTGTLTMNTQSGYTISGISWTIKANGGYSGVAGTYSIRQGAWTGVTTGLGSTAISSSSDMYLIPGSYVISCTYTLTKGDWTHQFTKSATVSLVGGAVNNITGTASGGTASEIVISVSLTAWGTQNHTPTFS